MFKNIRAVLLAWLFVSVMLSGEAFAQSVNDQFQYQLEQQRQQEMINQQSYQQNENYRRQQEEQSQSTNSGYSQPPRMVIVDRWGAVAFDNTTNSYGYSFNVGSRSEAKSKAISDCNSKSCEVVATYGNSCAAFAAGYKPEGGILWSFRRHDNLNIASEKAMNDCNAHANNCKVLMAECSRI